MELRRKELVFTLDGVEHKCRVATIGELKKNEEKMRDMSDEQTGEFTLEFLCSLGLTKDFINSLEPDHISQILEAMSLKKN